jgi:HAD superfamily hydrolase (TIGR01509 family)
MIKVVIFDLDGVLINAKQAHFEALNNALPEQYRLSAEEYFDYDGMPTKRKLEKLQFDKNLPIEFADQIIKNKNQYFQQYLDALTPNEELQNLFKNIKDCWGIKIYVASNAIQITVATALQKLGLSLLIDGFYSNQSVKYSKPHPEIYTSIIHRENISPYECLIVEDSPIGLCAAYQSGAHVLRVNSPKDLTIDLLWQAIKKPKQKYIWEDKTLNVLIPMAGEGKRFVEAGYTTPKPFITLKNTTLLQCSVDCLKVKGNLHFLAKEEHVYIVNLLYPNSKVIPVKEKTEGAACTTLLASDYIDNDNPLLIANCDQYVDYNALRFFYSMQNVDAGILTFYAKDAKWSYAEADDNGIVSKVAEKEVISDHATCGVYYWKHGRDYVKYAKQMITKNIRTNNEFYVCPVFNEAIADGKKVKIFPTMNMYGLGTPQDLVAVPDWVSDRLIV